MILEIDSAIMRKSPELRKMVKECWRLARDIRLRSALTLLLDNGEGYSQAVLALADLFDVSPATVKRAVKGLRVTPEQAAAKRKRPYTRRPPGRSRRTQLGALNVAPCPVPGIRHWR